jgi:hypothetical protein
MARVAATIVGGVLAALGIFGLIIVSVAWLAAASLAASGVSVDRTHKGDRLQGPAITGAESKPIIVEDQGANMTVVPKSVTLPAPPPRERAKPAAQQRPAEKPGAARGDQRRLEGCDPLISPLASPSLAHLAGRCLAAAELHRKFG